MRASERARARARARAARRGKFCFKVCYGASAPSCSRRPPARHRRRLTLSAPRLWRRSSFIASEDGTSGVSAWHLLGRGAGAEHGRAAPRASAHRAVSSRLARCPYGVRWGRHTTTSRYPSTPPVAGRAGRGGGRDSSFRVTRAHGHHLAQGARGLVGAARLGVGKLDRLGAGAMGWRGNTADRSLGESDPHGPYSNAGRTPAGQVAWAGVPRACTHARYPNL